jgi:hypothetical protein
MCWRFGPQPMMLLWSGGTFRRWGLVEGNQFAGGVPLEGILGPVSPLSLVYQPSWSELLVPHAPCFAIHPKATGQLTCCCQNKLFLLPKLIILDIFLVMGNWLNSLSVFYFYHWIPYIGNLQRMEIYLVHNSRGQKSNTNTGEASGEDCLATSQRVRGHHMAW